MSGEIDLSLEVVEKDFSELADITADLRGKLERLRECTQTLEGTEALNQLAAEFIPAVLRASQASLSAAQFILELFLSSRTGYEPSEYENEPELLGAAQEVAAEGLHTRKVSAKRRLSGSSLILRSERELSKYGQQHESRHVGRDEIEPGRIAERHPASTSKLHRLRFTEAEDAIFSEVYHELAPTIRSKVRIAKEIQARLPNGSERKGNVVYKHLLLLKEKYNWPNFSKDETSTQNGADDDGQVYLNDAVVSVRETHPDEAGDSMGGGNLKKLHSSKSGKLGGAWHL
jgi:hypothetical protein